MKREQVFDLLRDQSVYLIFYYLAAEYTVLGDILYGNLLILMTCLFGLLASVIVWDPFHMEKEQFWITTHLLSTLGVQGLLIVDPYIVYSAGLLTICHFWALSFVKGSLEQWHDFMASCLVSCSVLSAVCVFVPSAALETFVCFFGLCLFSGFVVYDLEQIDKTDYTIYYHAFSIYLDLVNILLRVVSIIERSRKKK